MGHGSDAARARRVGARAVRRSLANLNPSDCRPQTQCPLFSVLPPEIRNRVYEFALSQHEDDSRPYNEDHWYYRPGHHCSPRTETSLLETCRLIYYEANAVPMTSATHHVYVHVSPEKRDFQPNRLTRKNLNELNHVHYFPAFEESMYSIYRSILFLQPKRITLTFRYSDWFLWRNSKTYDASNNTGIRWPDSLSSWEQDLKLGNRCVELALELETWDEENEKKSLERIVATAAQWTFKRTDDTVLKIINEPPQVLRWIGQVDFAFPWIRDFYVVTLIYRPA